MPKHALRPYGHEKELHLEPQGAIVKLLNSFRYSFLKTRTFKSTILNLIQSLMASIREVATGFFVGILLLCGLFATLFIYQRHWDELSQLPIIKGLTEVYQDGLAKIGTLGEGTIQRFYADQLTLGTDVSIRKENDPQGAPETDGAGFTKNNQLIVYTSWDKENITAKLRQKGFSGRKLKNAQRFVNYIDQHQAVAMRDMQLHKVLASIKLAQALLESNAGSSGLATASNNQFGIKALPSSGARKKIKRKEFKYLRDDEFIFRPPAVGVFNMHDDHHYDRFEKYKTVGDSYARHTQLLTRPCSTGNKGCYSWIWSTFKVGRKPVDLSQMAKVYQKMSGYKAGDFFNGKTKVPYYAAAAAGLKMAGYATSRRYHQKLAYLIETYELWRLDSDLMAALERSSTARNEE